MQCRQCGLRLRGERKKKDGLWKECPKHGWVRVAIPANGIEAKIREAREKTEKMTFGQIAEHLIDNCKVEIPKVSWWKRIIHWLLGWE